MQKTHSASPKSQTTSQERKQRPDLGSFFFLILFPPLKAYPFSFYYSNNLSNPEKYSKHAAFPASRKETCRLEKRKPKKRKKRPASPEPVGNAYPGIRYCPGALRKRKKKGCCGGRNNKPERKWKPPGRGRGGRKRGSKRSRGPERQCGAPKQQAREKVEAPGKRKGQPKKKKQEKSEPGERCIMNLLTHRRLQKRKDCQSKISGCHKSKTMLQYTCVMLNEMHLIKAGRRIV